MLRQRYYIDIPGQFAQIEASSNLVGLLLNWGLLGTLSLQTYSYISAPHQLRRRSAAVYALCFLEVAQSLCLATGQVLDIIGRPIDFYWIALYIISPITCAATQAYYAKHLISLSRRHVWSGWIGAVCAFDILTGVSTGVCLVLYLNGQRNAPFQFMLSIWLCLNILGDLLIVVSMSILLHRRQWSCNGQSVGVLTRLAAIVVETGSLKLGCFILTFIFSIFQKWIPIIGLPLYLLSKISACTLLACLNNPTLNGEEPFRNIDLVGDIEDDELQVTKIQMHSDVHGGSGYENESAGLAYVQYGPVNDRG